ncbi:AbrB/MazE/SpoVT family DNA-binding domain-containing protein [bacterium]|nr:AbrB/MazE/SpoVT family DNA-binding domain-containing protein [bacterium]
MKTKIIKIDSSQGIKLSKVILKKLGTTKELELEIEQDKIVIRSQKTNRKGWKNAFKKMSENKDDNLLDELTNQSSWDETEWVWEEKNETV